MMADPLILYRAGSIDAEAAKGLLLERWPNAEVIADPEVKGVIVTDDPPNEWVVEPTADACVAIHVWRKLQHPSVGVPWWLRIMDAGVRGALTLHGDDVIWAAMEDEFSREGGVSGAMRYWRDCTIGAPSHYPAAGSAILRERKRWEDGRDAMRIERDGFMQTILELEGERRELRAALAWAMTSVCDDARDEGGCFGGWEDDCPNGETWGRYCSLARLDSPAEPP